MLLQWCWKAALGMVLERCSCKCAGRVLLQWCWNAALGMVLKERCSWNAALAVVPDGCS